MVLYDKGFEKILPNPIILNLTPVVRNDWEVYVNDKKFTQEIFNSDSKKYWGYG